MPELRLLIADDEEDERRGLRFLLDRYGYEFQIREASNGKEALGMMEEEPADILMTDVKMPFLTGTELATQVKERFPDTQIIFISGYDDFEYVKKALSLQAVDYILKPVNPSEFDRTMTLVVDRIRQEQQAADQALDFYKNYVLARILNQVSYEGLKQKYGEEQVRFVEDYTRLILVEFEADVFGREIRDIAGFARLIGGCVPCPYDFLDLTPSQGIFFLKGTETEDAYWRQVAQCAYLTFERNFSVSCCLGVSPWIRSPQGIGDAYEQAERSLEERFFYPDVHVFPMEKKKQQEALAKNTDSKILQMIERDLSCHDGYSLHRDVTMLIEMCRDNSFQSYIYTRFVCANLLKLLVKALPQGEERLAGLVEQTYLYTSFSELEGFLWKVIGEVEDNLRSEEDSPRRAVARVKQYIQEHYQEPLSLDILAEKVFLTPHYLSSIFIQENGEGINKYIKNVRMEKARDLLMHTNRKISDICEQVGYSNLSYFCRSFRNEYGVTPEQYRK